MKASKLSLVLCAAALAGSQAFAGLQIPYSPDAKTLHLWHFDDPLIVAGVTNILATDAVTTAGITLTNLGNPTPGVPPYNDTSLGSASFSGLGSSMQSTDKTAMCYGGLFPDVSSFCDTNTGAFTFELIVKFNANPVGPLPNNMELVAGDQPSGTLSVRGWQFRINNAKQMEFNLLGGNAADNDWKALLPTSGADAAIQGQWYHVAVTCTGNAPTNGDTPNVLNFYWTLLDANRTNADLLATFTLTRALNGTTGSGAGTVQPALGIGGSGRKITTGGNGVANGEGTIGNIDEVRISSVARRSNEMAFVTGGALNPPTFTLNPPASSLIGYGRTLTLSPLASGTLPLTFFWQLTNSVGGGWTNLPGQTSSTLTLSNVTFADAGFYRLVVTNNYGGRTSTVARVVVGAAISELFNTGVDANGVVDTNTLPNNPDLHYTLLQSSDAAHLGPSAIVWNMFTYPMALYSGNFANADNDSQWIGAQADSYASPVGQYTYRTTFLLDSADVTQPITLQGLWFENEIGNDILINGQSTGNGFSSVASSAGKFSAGFTITNGFVAGLNTLDFVTTRSAGANGSYQESAVRVEMSGVGLALPPGLPIITNQPVSQTVVDGNVASGSVATFSVVALGRPPLSYQWWADGAPVSGATGRTLTFVSPTSTPQPGTNFTVVVSNDSGSVTSSVAILTLLATNQPPVVANCSLVVYSNMTGSFNLANAFYAATDPDHDQIFLGAPPFDSVSTNGGSIIQNGVILTYTPVPGYVGQDEFNYYLVDSQGATSTGSVNIDVVPQLSPTVSSVSLSGGRFVLSGLGGGAGGSYHVLSSTDITLPLTNWTSLGSSAFDGTGHFNFTNAITPGTPRQFYILQVP